MEREGEKRGKEGESNKGTGKEREIMHSQYTIQTYNQPTKKLVSTIEWNASGILVILLC